MINRRDFIKKTSILGLSTLLIPSISSSNVLNNKEIIRIGLIGVGLRGRSTLGLLLKREDVIVSCICDIDPISISNSKKIFEKNNKKKPRVFSQGEYDYRNLLKRKDVDAVIISTPWKWHFEILKISEAQKLFEL